MGSPSYKRMNSPDTRRFETASIVSDRVKRIKSYWEEQATTYKASDEATAPDHFYRQHEIREVIRRLKPVSRILDVGCGNGYSTFAYADAYPDSVFDGIDFSKEMIANANETLSKRDNKNLKFKVGDITEPFVMDLHGKYYIVVCTRCLINLEDWESQKGAILNIKDTLRRHGKLILVENVKDGLESLNELRESFELDPIKERWHNSYLPLKELRRFLQQHFIITSEVNIGNMYYLISRVVYPALAKILGEEVSYGHPINKIAAQMPCLGSYTYSPNFLWELKKP